VTDVLLRDIEVGKFPLGSKLPSERDLTRSYGVSIGTIRRSLTDLQRRGLVRKEHGRGNFVSLQSQVSGAAGSLRDVGFIFERAERPGDQPAEDQVFLAFATACRRQGLRMTTFDLPMGGWGSGRDLIRAFDGARLDGICLFLHGGRNLSERLRELRDHVGPVVAWLPRLPREDVSMDIVTFEDGQGDRQLIDYMLQLGHRRIAFVGSDTGKQEQSGSDRAGDAEKKGARFVIYETALRARGLGVDPDLVFEVGNDAQPAAQHLDRLAERVRQGRITAVVAYNDWMASYVIRGLWERGLQAPRDYSITGFDDVDFASRLVPALTTLALPHKEAAKVALELMQARVKDPDRPFHVRSLRGNLVIRDSVGPPPAGAF
jgi:DNA-binding LacI/PurR family transcriptional regulator